MGAEHDPDAMSNLTGTYVGILVLEVIIVLALWLLGRVAS
jgi:hypothetical protein